MRGVGIVLVPLVVLTLAACGSADGTGVVTGEDLTIEVVVDVMSGVPNPTFTVSGEEAAALAEMVDALPSDGQVDPAAAFDLGFRGFVLRGLDLPADADQVRVRGADVIVSRGDAIGTLRTDQDRAIYTMLRGMSEAHLDQNVLQAIPVEGLKGS